MKVWVVTVTELANPNDPLMGVSVHSTREKALEQLLNDWDELPAAIKTWEGVWETWSAHYPELLVDLREVPVA